MHARSVLFKALRLLTLVGACTALSSHADDYTDISQLLRANKFPEAMTRVDSQLAAKPADPQLRFLKGVIQRNLGKQDDAIATFTKLTEDYPELPEPYNNLAVLYAGQGQYDKARVALEMAIRTNPSYATAHENIGDVYARLASQAYNKALQLDNNNAAVPPKLALIRELFKPNLPTARAASATPVVVAAATPAPAAKPAPIPAPAVAPPSKPVATVVPVKPAAPVVAPTTPAAKPVPVPAEADAAKDAEAAVMAWAKAWAAKDMNAYLGAYSPEFKPSGKQSRSAWEKDRRDRIMGKSRISLTLDNMSAKVNGDEAVVKFHQAYKADALSVASRKTLTLKKRGNRWLITQESTGN
ncbi:MAG: tetratricopeptide repeat protein [Rhodoferax sp.]|uniref:tetratricopeptide repeat protein n=1 Tax=Rhodoferax sp. TaxID=50421 RepID=UPI002604D385|nr:tetratricopeptide repeat protein [Rhodoferax sp.]MDD2879013.1 tetratricopeptide repeat protein [Rhodoferax sp.]